MPECRKSLLVGDLTGREVWATAQEGKRARGLLVERDIIQGSDWGLVCPGDIALQHSRWSWVTKAGTGKALVRLQFFCF